MAFLLNFSIFRTENPLHLHNLKNPINWTELLWHRSTNCLSNKCLYFNLANIKLETESQTWLMLCNCRRYTYTTTHTQTHTPQGLNNDKRRQAAKVINYPCQQMGRWAEKKVRCFFLFFFPKCISECGFDWRNDSHMLMDDHRLVLIKNTDRGCYQDRWLYLCASNTMRASRVFINYN